MSLRIYAKRREIIGVYEKSKKKCARDERQYLNLFMFGYQFQEYGIALE